MDRAMPVRLYVRAIEAWQLAQRDASTYPESLSAWTWRICQEQLAARAPIRGAAAKKTLFISRFHSPYRIDRARSRNQKNSHIHHIRAGGTGLDQAVDPFEEMIGVVVHKETS